MTTPRLSLPEIAQSQSDKYVTHNEAMRAVDALLPKTAISIGDLTPPGSPSNGDVYIVGSGSPSPTGDWAGYEDYVAYYNSAWAFIAPIEGLELYVQDVDSFYKYDGASWVVSAGSGNVTGPGSSTDNAVARFDGTDGTDIQNSGVLIDDDSNLYGNGTKINLQTGTSYTLAASDNGKTIEASNASAMTIVVPEDSAVTLPVGFWCMVVQVGFGTVTITDDGSSPSQPTINSKSGARDLSDQYAAATIYKRGSNDWVLIGDLA